MAANAKSKYDALNLDAPAEPAPVALPPQEPPSPHHVAPKSVGRPVTSVAKTKNPNMKQYSIILDIDAHADANHLLKKARNEGDMSDLLNRLLAGWVAERKAALS